MTALLSNCYVTLFGLLPQRHGDTRDLLAQQRKKMNDNIQYSPPHRQREAREREKDINEH